MRQKAMSLVELLVVVMIVLVAAAVLFPVFSQQHVVSRKTVCLSNTKQIGLAALMYADDADNTYFRDRVNCGGTAANGYRAVEVCDVYRVKSVLSAEAPDQSNPSTAGGSASSPANERLFWAYTLQPYFKHYTLLRCPLLTNGFYPGGGEAVKFTAGRGAENSQNFGGENSYGVNFGWIAATPAKGGLPTPVQSASIPRPPGTILFTDAGFYEVGPDVTNATGLTVCNHLTAGACPSPGAANAEYVHLIGGPNPANQHPYLSSYWANQGGGRYSQDGGNPTYVSSSSSPTNGVFVEEDSARHVGRLNAAFFDGHAKSLAIPQTIGDICYWTTDVEGKHPACK